MKKQKLKSVSYEIEALNKSHVKAGFQSGVESLDRYLKNQAAQDMKKNVSVTHVLKSINSQEILGFYTLSSITIFPGEIPDDLVKKLPRYPVLPGVLLGRLAVDQQSRGQGLGAYLLVDALRRSLVVSSQMGVLSIVVDAKSEEAISFYKQYGFISLLSNRNRLFLPLSVIKDFF